MVESVAYHVNSPFVVHELFEDGEVVIINLKSGNYYSLNNVAANIWVVLEGGATQGAIVDSLTKRYVGSLADMINTVSSFLADLLHEELIVTTPPAGAPASGEGGLQLSQGPEQLAFEAPVIDRYNDMQDLLLLDPIHDVGDAGWPQRRPDTAD